MPLHSPHCPHCGTEVSDDARYCLRCGRERPQPQYVPPVPLEAMETATATPARPHPVHHTPPPAPPLPPPAPPRRSLAVVWTATLAAAFVIGGGATAGVLLLSDDGGGTDPSRSRDDKPVVAASERPSGSAPETPGASVAPMPTPTATPTPTEPSPPSNSESTTTPHPTTAPPGYRRVTDPAGFSLAVPEVWFRQNATGGQITYAGSTGMEHLLVGVVHNPPYSSSYENFLSIEKKAKAGQQDFRRLRLERNTFQGRPGAIWEYTFTDKQTGETLHAIDQGYIAPNGTDYSIYTKGRDRDWQYSRKIFDTALATWTLGG